MTTYTVPNDSAFRLKIMPGIRDGKPCLLALYDNSDGEVSGEVASFKGSRLDQLAELVHTVFPAEVIREVAKLALAEAEAARH